MIDRLEFKKTVSEWGEEIVAMNIDIFCSEFEERFIRIRKNVAERDFKELEFTAHSLKGNVVLFMDPVTIQLSKRLVEMARQHITTGLDEVFADMEANSRLLLEELKVIRKGLTS